MEQIAFTMQLHPEKLAEFRRRQDALWPELVQALRDAGVRDYSVFLDSETNELFAVLRRTKGQTFGAEAQQQIMQRWWGHLSDIVQTRADGTPWQRTLVPMFHVD